MTRAAAQVDLPAGLQPLLNRQQLAAYLGVSLRTIDRMENDGQLPPALVIRRGVSERATKRWDPRQIQAALQPGARGN